VNKSLELSVSLGLVYQAVDLLTRLAMNYREMGLYGNAIKYLDRAHATSTKELSVSKFTTLMIFNWELFIETNDERVEALRKQARHLLVRIKGTHWHGYYCLSLAMYHYYRFEMEPALSAMREARHLYARGGVTDDAARSGIKEALILIELNRFREAKQVIRSLDRFSQELESKNIHGEYCAIKLAYHYRIRSQPAVLKRHFDICQNAFREVKEMSVILMVEKLMFRVMARLGDLGGATTIFRSHVERIKKIASNMPTQEQASRFLNKPDERLLMEEFKLVEKKKARSNRAFLETQGTRKTVGA
jgi:hypothetical protein